MPGKGPVIRDGVEGASRPATETFPYVARAKSRTRPSSRSTTDVQASAVSSAAGIQLELDDIQGGALHPRPSPYVGTYLLLRIDDREAGRELVRRLQPLVGSGRVAPDRSAQAWVTVAFTYNGLKALGVPQDSLDSFAPEFRAGHGGTRARAR